MITHLCHDLEIDRKGFPFFLTMTKEEITCMHNSRRKQFSLLKREEIAILNILRNKKNKGAILPISRSKTC